MPQAQGLSSTMEPEALSAWLRLIRCPGLGSGHVYTLIERYGSAEAAVLAGSSGWKAVGIPDNACAALAGIDRAQVENDLEWCSEPRRGLITFQHPGFPALLRDIAGCPPALFYRGDSELLGVPQIAVVGSRTATPQGIENAENFSSELARRGLCVTSGLALGVDGAAHRGALLANGSTIAVCATGLDRVYPARHKELAREIERTGLLISEFALGTAPRSEHFPRRNRLISGLVLGVLVVEAARRSGSLITARLAGEQGRDVYAIPGSIHNVMARGCHQLIRSGAKLVESVDDILEEIGGQVGEWLRASQARPLAPAANETAEHRHHQILDALGDEPQAIDSIVEKSGISVEILSAALLELELEGLVAAVPGGAVMRLRAGQR